MRAKVLPIFVFLAAAVLAVLLCNLCEAGPLADQASCRIYVNHGGTTSIGSGTLIDRDHKYGVVLTCAHLFVEGGDLEFVNSPKNIRVVFRDGKQHYGQCIRYNKHSDLAAIRISTPWAKPVALAEPSRGEQLHSTGFGPDGNFQNKNGAAVGEANTPGQMSIVTSFPSRSGDSGGGLFNRQDQLVGVVWGSAQGQTYSSFRTPLRNFLHRAFTGRSAPKIFVPNNCPGGVCRPQQPNCPNGQCPLVPQPPVRPDPGDSTSIVDPRWETYAQRIDALEAKLELIERTPGPMGPPGPPGPAGPQGLAGTSPSADEIARQVALIVGNQQPKSVTHYVLVADREASYWRRTGELAARAQEAYSQIRITPPPSFAVGALPQMVAYKDGDPIGAFRGQRQVEDALATLARGESPKPS